MKIRSLLSAIAGPMLLTACSGLPEKNTLSDLHAVEPDLNDLVIEDSLERAEASYRRYLEETPSRVLTPEAMRRMADLQLEREFGVIGTGEMIEAAVQEDAAELTAPQPERGELLEDNAERAPTGLEQKYGEEQAAFESRASAPLQLAGSAAESQELPGMSAESGVGGPLAAIETYRKILKEFPNYERNDQVLYQMSRAYDELGESEDAMDVMAQLIQEYPDSRYIDEVYFRRGEYFFVRKKYLDAEESYQAIIDAGSVSSYFELALYKLGWTLYKQEFYEEALDCYIAMLDYRISIGFDFDQQHEQDQEHRVEDTFRVISLSFSNMGGSEVIDEYFAAKGSRSYADKIYRNLGEFYLDKLRYQDAAAVYNSFVDLNPSHRVAPHFSMRVIEIYEKGEFPQLVVESKKGFAQRYAVDADYWSYYEISEATEVMDFLKTNLTDLATHYHALYQNEELVVEQAENYAEALHWYQAFLSSFPEDIEAPPTNYRLADLLLENKDFAMAALEYERTAYDYSEHEQSAAAGYAAVFAHRQNLETVSGSGHMEVQLATVESSLRFTESFPDHEEAPAVVGAAADDLYAMQDYERAINSAHMLIDRYPESGKALIRSAWVVVAHSSIDIAQYVDAEDAYVEVLALTGEDDETRGAIVDGLAAAIYKQGEQALLLEDYGLAASHFLRIRDIAPGSAVAVSASYDGAMALVQLEVWGRASEVFESFRSANPDHELAPDATKQLADIYRKDGQTDRSAAEHVRIADEATDPDLSREALLIAAELYEEAELTPSALQVYERYIAEFPKPVDVALQTRMRMAEIYKQDGQLERYHAELRTIISIDEAAGAERTERTRYLAAQSSLVLTEIQYQRFAALRLVQPFEKSLAEKQASMDETLLVFEALVDYEVGVVTAAATYYIAEIYFNFSQSLLESERPEGMNPQELTTYEMVLEEEAYPFEEQAIQVHEQNFELLSGGLYNDWVARSIAKLAYLMPGRFAKAELASEFLGSIDFYTYRMPIVPEVGPAGDPLPNEQDGSDQAAIFDDEQTAQTTAQLKE